MRETGLMILLSINYLLIWVAIYRNNKKISEISCWLTRFERDFSDLRIYIYQTRHLIEEIQEQTKQTEEELKHIEGVISELWSWVGTMERRIADKLDTKTGENA